MRDSSFKHTLKPANITIISQISFKFNFLGDLYTTL